MGIRGFLIKLKNWTIWYFSQHRFAQFATFVNFFFGVLSACCVHHFLNSVLSLASSFFQTRTLLIQKLLYFFKLVRLNPIFYFLQLMQPLTLCTPGKMQHPPNFLIPIFYYHSFLKTMQCTDQDVLVSGFKDLLFSKLKI